MSKTFLGWDCANKTLAWSYVTIDTHLFAKLKILSDMMSDLMHTWVGNGGSEMLHMNLEDPEFVDELLSIINAANYFVDNFLQYHSAGVADILDGRKVSDTDEIERTRALSSFLNKFVPIDASAIVVIEHQPSKVGAKTNNKSTAVSYQLAFHYIKHNPIMISPKLKNNISLNDDLRFINFVQKMRKYKSKKDAAYAARKAHSRENFLYLLASFDLEYITDNIPNAVLDDLADSTMQILAYLVENKLFINV